MSVFTKRRKESYKILQSVEGLPKHSFDFLDIISPPAIVGAILLVVAIVVYVVTV